MSPQSWFDQKESQYVDLVCNRNHVICVPSDVGEA
jgi:hypothetical protein